MKEELTNDKTLFSLSDELVAATKKVVRGAKTEEDLRISFEKLIDPLLKNIGVNSIPKYERLSGEARTVYRGRPDAVHGQVIIEMNLLVLFLLHAICCMQMTN